MIACGLPPTVILAVTRSVAGSIRLTVPSPLLATQTEPAPTVDAEWSVADPDPGRHRPRVWIDPHDLVVAGIGHPDATGADRDP